MINYSELIRDSISKALSELSWKCSGCPQVPICEGQSSDGEERYCWPMIEAAILGHDTWETAHNKPIQPTVEERGG